MSNNIYACDPSEAAAEVCWPATASVLCLVDPWSKALRRFASPGALPAIDRSNPVWTVRVGQLGPPLTPLGFLTQHSVKRAWFAASH